MAYDIAIVGAGPAGATLARLLNPNYKVLLLDKRDLVEGENEKRSKCCGGLLAPDAQHMLGKMGLAVPTSILVDPQLFLVRTIDFDNLTEQFYQRFYFNMDRKRFDEWLVSLVPESVDMAMGCRFTSLSEAKEGYEIAFLHDNKIYTEKVKLIVGADGAWSNVRKQLFPQSFNMRKYISIQEWFETDETIPYYGAIFDSDVTDFYSWTISKDGLLIIGSALDPNKEANEKFELLKSNLREYGFRFGKRVKREGAYLLRPRKGDTLTGNDHCAFIGEAGGFISPSSAEGLSYAMKSAYALAMSLNDGLDGFQKRYRKRVSSLKTNIMLKRMKSPAMYNRTLRNVAMKSGLMSSKVLFES
ncbi:MAG: FAD-binding protein [Clostridia bacterium]|nr:FAD-binding protein [Clostridia bacterium]